MVRKSVQRQFAPGFPVPAQSVRDVRRMTYSSYTDSLDGFRDVTPLSARVARLNMPVLVIWWTRDQLVNPGALNDYRAVPAAHIVQIDGAGRSAMVERPR